MNKMEREKYNKLYPRPLYTKLILGYGKLRFNGKIVERPEFDNEVAYHEVDVLL